MRAGRAAVAIVVLAGGLGLIGPTGATASTGDRDNAQRAAASRSAPPAPEETTRQVSARGTASRSRQAAISRTVAQRGGLSCVPYARQVTGLAIRGDGREWWHKAAGLYERGQQPEVGAVMAFPSSGGMRRGHVAVVERVIGPREILIHHANWAGPGIRRGTVMRGVSVVDVSPANDWTQVRVQVGHSKEAYGRVYPVYGFIYDRPDMTGGVMLAGTSRSRRSTRVARAGNRTELAEALNPHAAQHLELAREVLAVAQQGR